MPTIVYTAPTSILQTLGSSATPLFNGNIAAMAVNIPKLKGAQKAMDDLAYSYRVQEQIFLFIIMKFTTILWGTN
jgi:hypothetical protein